MLLSVSRRGEVERRLAFSKTEVNLGCAQGNDVVLTGTTVDDHHARLLYRDGRFIVTDLKSATGTYVNDRKIAQATIFRYGDILGIGGYELRCIDESQPDAPLPRPLEPPRPMNTTSAVDPGSPGGPMERSTAPDAFRGRGAVSVHAPITAVVVHARGALVTREVELPADLPGGTVEVLVAELTALANAGSVRASLSLTSPREIVQLEVALAYSEATPEPSPTQSLVREVEERIARYADEGVRLARRRELLQTIQLGPNIRTRDRRQVPRDAIVARFVDSLRIAELVTTTVATLDEQLHANRQALALAEREREAAKLEDAQASSARKPGGHKSLSVVVRLRGEGAPGKLTITYAVPAARFWPTYALRLTDGGRRASWSFDVLVAQKTGEDWSSAALSFSTGDLLFDARLPELPSLRLGRRVAPRMRAFRPPPEGVETMFTSYLAFAAVVVTAHPPPLHARPASQPHPESASDDEYTPVRTAARAFDLSPEPARVMPRAMAMSMSPMLPSPSPPRGGFGGPPGGANAPRDEARFDDDEDTSAAYRSTNEEAEAHEIMPSTVWEDYDRLVLAPAEDASARGQLVVVADHATRQAIQNAAGAIDRIDVPGHRDPVGTRGTFDHRYDGLGTADVPSDGAIHRVAIRSADCATRVQHTTVPAHGPEVYREALFANPFTGPLLGGPIEVYLDGTLLTTTPLESTDRGGEMRVGMGVDERISVARNVRSSEESAGILGGSRAVTNTVSIEIIAAVRDPLAITVIERYPVTDDKSLKIELLGERPNGAPYDQIDRGQPARGGRRFDLTLAPGQRGHIEIGYRLVFSNKADIVGGGRRE